MDAVSRPAGKADPTPERPRPGPALRDAMGAAAKRRAKQRDLRPLTRLAPIVAAHKGDALAAVLFLLVSSAATLSLTVGARVVVNAGLPGGQTYAHVGFAFGLLSLFAAVQAIAAGSRFYFFTRLGERVVADLRQVLYRHILTLDQGYFLKVRTGEVLSRMTTDVAIVEGLVASSSSTGLRNGLLAVGAVGMLVAVSPRMTGIVLIMIPLVLVPLITYGRRVRRLSVAAQDRFAEAVGYAGETLDALDTVQAFGREASAADQFDAAVDEALSRVQEAHPGAGGAHRRSHAAGVRRGRRDPVVGRAGRPRGNHERGRVGPVHVPVVPGGQFGGQSRRGVGRRAEGRRRHGADHRTPRRQASHLRSRPPHSPA